MIKYKDNSLFKVRFESKRKTLNDHNHFQSVLS